MLIYNNIKFRHYGRSPSWGAWIEIHKRSVQAAQQGVAPPRGERGLKLPIVLNAVSASKVAPPRGERGLK